jgi:hypothetical protein
VSLPQEHRDLHRSHNSIATCVAPTRASRLAGQPQVAKNGTLVVRCEEIDTGVKQDDVYHVVARIDNHASADEIQLRT